MAETADGLLSIEIDADNYAETAAGDVQSVPRTYQSEADFQAQKASYHAKVDHGNNYQKLILAVPTLAASSMTNGDGVGHDTAQRTRLSKKDLQLLGYAVGEMYYDREYTGVLELCTRVKQRCEIDTKTAESVARWISRCEDRLARTA
ncbi:hypothetical protein BAUCODRAFT_147585 [Baudoinia panamericana UAMH 10762]|uniref:Uncharacterized protein n=1 Tax=Baudoinia panamericana (strain UAMH 10762) TaxID=717646 RepID=M2LSR8_BAUPA|nr:uncharacterized protein BAUCODRAFT_147585 [Baudoinia panamericana UAMH 10762]EMC97517.1 hypothetical protein BAUCODRAFT_147585 [Baudoinia panamericana UAMH 10762]